MGDPRGSSIINGDRHQRVKDITEKHLAQIKGGVSETDISRWVAEHDEARKNLRQAEPILAALEEEQVKKRLTKYSGPGLGKLQVEKPEGYHRFMSVQLNGIATRLVREVKVEQLTRLINRYDSDLLTFTEHGLNMGQFPPSQTFASFFQTEIELRSTTGHNSFENPESRHQQGGTGIMAVGELLEYYTPSNHDFRKLGRWTSALIAGSPQHRTRVVTAYCVGKQKTAGFGRVYQQHLRYLQHKGWADT